MTCELTFAGESSDTQNMSSHLSHSPQTHNMSAHISTRVLKQTRCELTLVT
jgi:hypothetical protein